MYGGWGLARRAFSTAKKALPRPRFSRRGGSARGSPERLIREDVVPSMSRRARLRAERKRRYQARALYVASFLVAALAALALLASVR
jgi:hypothetical protein